MKLSYLGVCQQTEKAECEWRGDKMRPERIYFGLSFEAGTIPQFQERI